MEKKESKFDNDTCTLLVVRLTLNPEINSGQAFFYIYPHTYIKNQTVLKNRLDKCL